MDLETKFLELFYYYFVFEASPITKTLKYQDIWPHFLLDCWCLILALHLAIIVVMLSIQPGIYRLDCSPYYVVTEPRFSAKLKSTFKNYFTEL